MGTFLSRVIIIGIGLIGGSLGLALKKRHLARLVVGVDVRPDCLQNAEKLGIVDRCAVNLDEAFEMFHSYDDFLESDDFASPDRRSDLIVVCTPVGSVAEEIFSVSRIVEDKATLFERPILMTDVGSTKFEIANTLQGRLSPHVKYVGSHPIAGSEKSGYEHANADIFTGRLAILSPTDNDHTAEVTLLEQFWTLLGSSVIQIPPQTHDLILARTSHFPHLLSFLAPQLLKQGDQLAIGPGFRSFSRLAASDPTLWTDVFLSNKDAMLHVIDEMRHQLELFRHLLEEEDRPAIFSLLSRAKQIREVVASS